MYEAGTQISCFATKRHQCRHYGDLVACSKLVGCALHEKKYMTNEVTEPSSIILN